VVGSNRIASDLLTILSRSTPTTEAVKLDPEPIAIGYDEEGELARVPYHAPMHPFHRFHPRAEYSQRAEDYAAQLTEKGEK
jgi:hypothetical protein